jgi:hypothetical protein
MDGSGMPLDLHPFVMYWIVVAITTVLGLFAGLMARGGAVMLSRLVLVFVNALLIGVLVHAFMNGRASAEIEVLFTLPFGQLTVVDLFVGFVFAAVVILAVERSILMGLLMTIPLFILGNVWLGIWLVLRLPELLRRLRPAPSDTPAPAPAALSATPAADPQATG